jgi:hypothetical protein
MKLIQVAAWSAAGVLGIGVLTGVAAAVADTTQAADGDAVRDRVGERRGHRRARWALRRVEHGEFVVRTAEGHQTVHVQRGTISAVSATAMTVRSRDGFTETWTITGETKIRKERKPAQPSALKVGDWVRVFGPESGSGATARRIAARTEAPADPGAAGKGTTG